MTEPGLARSAHFEVYSQAGEASARSVLLAFERLHTFFSQQPWLRPNHRKPVRVIAFRSAAEYEPYQLRPAADGYYVGTGSRDYIVMTSPGPGGSSDLPIAAHEYAHFVLHSKSLDLPPWLEEGLSEFFSTVRLNEVGEKPRAELPARSRALRNRTWMPLSELLALPADSPLRDQRDTSDLFYAQSWVLTDMLMVSPDYEPRFPQLIARLTDGTPGPQAIAAVYSRSLQEVTADLHSWIDKRRITPTLLPNVSADEVAAQVSAVTPLAWQSLLAEVLLATGKLDRAQAAYRDLAREAPEDPDFSAALALIALRKHDPDSAREQWQRALAQGIRDAAACYQYAVLGGDAGLLPDDIRPALDRAVAVQPDFDDAHYMLAHLDNNAGRYESAVGHLRAMASVTPARQFMYWAAMAYALSELGRREEASAAAGRAREHAKTPEERVHADQLENIAQTDMSVRFVRDASGNSRLVTVRVPHDADWNPFIEPSDVIRRVEGRLREIDCSGGSTKVAVETAAGIVTVAITDPLRVQMRNAPPEFTCGPQPRTAVTVVYAALENPKANTRGVVRGIEFH